MTRVLPSKNLSPFLKGQSSTRPYPSGTPISLGTLELVWEQGAGAPGESLSLGRWDTIWETLTFDTERRETFVSTVFAFPNPIPIRSVLFLKSQESQMTSKGSKRGGRVKVEK